MSLGMIRLNRLHKFCVIIVASMYACDDARNSSLLPQTHLSSTVAILIRSDVVVSQPMSQPSPVANRLNTDPKSS